MTTTNLPDPLFADGRPQPGAADLRLEQLYEQHGRTVLGLCRMLLRDPSEAEDAAQQSFLSAYRSLLAGSEPRYPAAWLATIARNECWARIQQRMRQPIHESLAEETAASTPGPLDAAIRNADLAALVAAIGELPRQQRDALLMREFSGLSYGELAQALSVSEPAVESLLVRARRELRVRLQPAYAACLAPFLFLRDLFSRLGAGGESNLGAAAKLASVPLTAKLATGAVTIGLLGGALVGVDRQLVETGSAELPRRAATRTSGAADVGATGVGLGGAQARHRGSDETGEGRHRRGSSADDSPSSGEDDDTGDDNDEKSGSGDDSGSEGPSASTPGSSGNGRNSGDDDPDDDSSSSGPGSAGAEPGDDGDGDEPTDDDDAPEPADDDGGGDPEQDDDDSSDNAPEPGDD